MKKKATLPESNANWKIVDPEDARKEIKAQLSKKKPAVKKKAGVNKTEQIKKETPATLPKKPGRSTKYDPESHPLMAWVLAVLGKTNIEIAAELTISSRTLHEWGKKHPEFLSSVKGGKSIANARVVKALFRRCIGEKTTRKRVIQNPDGTLRKEVTEEEIMPDVGAIALWLPNRDPANWKNRANIEHTGADGAPLESTIIILPDNGRDKTAKAGKKGH